MDTDQEHFDSINNYRLKFAELLQNSRELISDSTLHVISLVEQWLIDCSYPSDENLALKEKCIAIYKAEVDSTVKKIEKTKEAREHLEKGGKLLADFFLNNFVTHQSPVV